MKTIKIVANEHIKLQLCLECAVSYKLQQSLSRQMQTIIKGFIQYSWPLATTDSIEKPSHFRRFICAKAHSNAELGVETLVPFLPYSELHTCILQ